MMIALVLAGVALSTAPVQAQQRTLCVHGLEAPQYLTVRSGPGTASRVVGRFPAKACGVRLAGRCAGDWCQMALDGTTGWVDTRHIGIYEVPAGPANAAAATAGATSTPDRTVSTAPAAEPSIITGSTDSDRAAPREKPPFAGNPKPRKMARSPDADANRRAAENAAADGACVTNVDRGDTLRIRTGPGVGYDEIGDLPPRACGVSISERCRGNWCRISWRGRRGWVNTNYLD